MTFSLDDVVPWGRSYDEYVAMFALSASDLAGRILGAGDGPAAFNAELTRRGGRVVSVDPLYRFSAEAIRAQIAATYPTVLEQTRQNAREFVWTEDLPSVEALGQRRLAAMETFLADYPAGQALGRYRDASLPQLPFAEQRFDLTLCSHLLFLYSVQRSAAFHLAAIRELCRVARVVRIFPLIELRAVPSRHLEAVMAALQAGDWAVSVVPVPYEFQRGGNQMLQVERCRC